MPKTGAPGNRMHRRNCHTRCGQQDWLNRYQERCAQDTCIIYVCTYMIGTHTHNTHTHTHTHTKGGLAQPLRRALRVRPPLRLLGSCRQCHASPHRHPALVFLDSQRRWLQTLTHDRCSYPLMQILSCCVSLTCADTMLLFVVC